MRRRRDFDAVCRQARTQEAVVGQGGLDGILAGFVLCMIEAFAHLGHEGFEGRCHRRFLCRVARHRDFARRNQCGIAGLNPEPGAEAARSRLLHAARRPCRRNSPRLPACRESRFHRRLSRRRSCASLTLRSRYCWSVRPERTALSSAGFRPSMVNSRLPAAGAGSVAACRGADSARRRMTNARQRHFINESHRRRRGFPPASLKQLRSLRAGGRAVTSLRTRQSRRCARRRISTSARRRSGRRQLPGWCGTGSSPRRCPSARRTARRPTR